MPTFAIVYGVLLVLFGTKDLESPTSSLTARVVLQNNTGFFHPFILSFHILFGFSYRAHFHLIGFTAKFCVM